MVVVVVVVVVVVIVVVVVVEYDGTLVLCISVYFIYSSTTLLCAYDFGSSAIVKRL